MKNYLLSTMLFLLTMISYGQTNWQYPAAAVKAPTTGDAAWMATLSTANQKGANLSDVTSVATARTNLGLATVAATGSYSALTNRPTTIPGTKLDIISSVPVTDIPGYVLANGRLKSTLTPTQQVVATTLGYGTTIPAITTLAPLYTLIYLGL